MCKYKGCDQETPRVRKLYCGDQDDWGTCAYKRNQEVTVIRQLKKDEADRRKIYKKICKYCNKKLITKVHNQERHGNEKTKGTCSYKHMIIRNVENKRRLRRNK